MTVTIVSHVSHGIQVHKPGCADITRAQQRRKLNGSYDLEIKGKDIAAEVAAHLCDEFSDPNAWRAEHVKVMACCKESR